MEEELLDLLGSSPKTVFNYDIVPYNKHDARESQKDVNNVEITDFIRELPKRIFERKAAPIELRMVCDPVMDIFRCVQLSQQEMELFAHFDFSKSYTRNLVATDNKTYTLLLLCWTPGQHSPIHDHPCDGCWMKVLKGQISECRFQKDPDFESLVLTQDATYYTEEAVYMEDSLGLHSVGNPSSTFPATTLHLYCPPIKQCRVWMDETARPEVVTVKHFSEYGCIL